MGVSKNRGTPKWMVKIMENPIKIDDLGVPLFLETPIWELHRITVHRSTKSLLSSQKFHFGPTENFILRAIGLAHDLHGKRLGAPEKSEALAILVFKWIDSSIPYTHVFDPI